MTAAVTRLTKAQLLARIDEVEAECAAHIREIEALRTERDALYAAQRPSRTVQITRESSRPVVTMRGVRCYKLTAWEGGRLVTTYRPVETVQ